MNSKQDVRKKQKKIIPLDYHQNHSSYGAYRVLPDAVPAWMGVWVAPVFFIAVILWAQTARYVNVFNGTELMYDAVAIVVENTVMLAPRSGPSSH